MPRHRLQRYDAKWMRAALMALFFALLSALPALGAKFDDAWLEGAADPSRVTELSSEITLFKMRNGYNDFSPLAMRLAEASAKRDNPAAALALAELAVVAAPADPRAHAAVASAAMGSFHSPGKALIALWQYAKTTALDPWAQLGVGLRVALALGFTGLLVALALALSGVYYYFPLFAHDVRDRFPASFRTFTPIMVMLFALMALAWLGGGIILFLLLPVVGMIAYMPMRTRVVLLAGLLFTLLLFPVLDSVSSMAGERGERAWTAYRVLKGDAGEELEAQVERHFPGEESKGLHMRALLARRAGNTDLAEELLQRALPTGDKGLINFELGSLKLMEKNLSSAAAHLEEASRYMPEDWMIWYTLNGVYLALLELDSANAALTRARAIDAEALELHQMQAGEATAGGTQAFSRLFPGSWVTDELCAGLCEPSEWSGSLWAVIGVSISGFSPFYLMILVLVAFFMAQGAQKANLTKRCDSCGALRCFTCNTVAKGSDVCGGCLALTKRDDIDEASRAKLRLQISKWSLRTSKAAHWGEVLLPGWSAFLYKGGFGPLLVGLVWAASLAVLLSRSCFDFQYLVWPVTNISWAALVLWLLTHLGAALAARKR